MTDARAGLDAPQQFELRSPLVVQALVVAAALAPVGAVLVVLWRALDWNVIPLVLGLLLMLAGVLLTGAALIAYRRGRQVVVLGGGEITVRSRGAERRVALRDVNEVKVSDVGLRMLLTEGLGEPVEVVNPGGRGEAVFVAMMRAVQAALETDRGYRPLE